MKLALVVAMTDSRVIGRGGQLPWKLSEDLKRFKALTMGHAVIMGRRTWESLPASVRPLPGRENIVLSRDAAFRAPGAEVCTSLKQAVGHLAPAQSLAFVIGGAALFAEALPVAERIHLTLIHHDFEGDVYFPELDLGRFNESSRTSQIAPEGYRYEFIDLTRKETKP